MKKSAVEWFADNVLSYKHPTNINGTDYILIPINKVEYLTGQAKEMEKKQIVTAYDLAYMDSFVDDVCKNDKPNDGEAFYNWYYGR